MAFLDGVLFKTEWVEDKPDVIDNNIIYISTREFPFFAVFQCPICHGHRIVLHLGEICNPRWDIVENKDGLISITPSVDYPSDIEGNASCHFTITEGRVDKVEVEEPPVENV